jgi:hypothetical protein
VYLALFLLALAGVGQALLFAGQPSRPAARAVAPAREDAAAG